MVYSQRLIPVVYTSCTCSCAGVVPLHPIGLLCFTPRPSWASSPLQDPPGVSQFVALKKRELVSPRCACQDSSPQGALLTDKGVSCTNFGLNPLPADFTSSAAFFPHLRECHAPLAIKPLLCQAVYSQSSRYFGLQNHTRCVSVLRSI